MRRTRSHGSSLCRAAIGEDRRDKLLQLYTRRVDRCRRSISWGVLFALTTSTALAQSPTPTIETCRLRPRPWRTPTGRALTWACAYRRFRRLPALSCRQSIPPTTPPQFCLRRPAVRRHGRIGIPRRRRWGRQPLVPRHEESQYLRAGRQDRRDHPHRRQLRIRDRGWGPRGPSDPGPRPEPGSIFHLRACLCRP
jgi:hypothetical protein